MIKEGLDQRSPTSGPFEKDRIKKKIFYFEGEKMSLLHFVSVRESIVLRETGLWRKKGLGPLV